MSFTFNKIYVQSRLVFAFSALAEMSVVRAQSSIGHYNISRGNSIVSVLEEAVLTAQHAEEMPVPPITIHATPPSPGIQSGHPVAPVFPASLSIDIEITHYYTHSMSTSRVQGAAPTFTAFTTTVHSRSSTRSTVSMAESTSSPLAPISDRVSIMVVTPMLPLFSPSPVNDRPTVNDYTITVQDSQPPSSSLVFASTFSRPLPRTTLVPSDGHAVDSGSARNGFKDAAPVVVIVVSILVTGILVYAYYALKRKWQRHRQATAAAAVRDDDLALYKPHRMSEFVLPHPELTELAPSASPSPSGPSQVMSEPPSPDVTLDDCVPWTEPELSRRNAIKLTQFKPVVTRSMRTRATRRSRALPFGMTMEAPPSREEQTKCSLPRGHLPHNPSPLREVHLD